MISEKDCPICKKDWADKNLTRLSENELELVNHIYEIHDLMTPKDLIKMIVQKITEDKND